MTAETEERDQPPAWRRPSTVAIAVVVAAAVLVRHGVGGRGLIGAGFAAVLVVLAAIDLEQRIIPNRIVLPASVVVLVAQIAWFPDRAGEWLLAAFGAAAFLALPLVFVRGGLGMGDIKLALLLGAGLGEAVIDALFYAALAGAALGIVLLLRHGGAAKRMSFPFGPFLAGGGIIALLSGHHIG